MEQKQIASFVVRFHLADVNEETSKKLWRIKVTHVQEEMETFFDTAEDAFDFMKAIVGES